MRLLVLSILLFLLTPINLLAADTGETESTEIESKIRQEQKQNDHDKELIADLELIELLDLLENFNALASMEDKP